MDAEMVPLSLARIEDLGPGDFVRIDCAACGHTALLTQHPWPDSVSGRD
jgi:hypothetical protein